MIDFLATVGFPSGTGIAGAVFSVLQWLYGGIGSYAVAVIILALILRTMMLPIDFGTKYFQKQNSIRMAEIKPEEQMLREQYADDPVAFNRAKQALYKKHGALSGGLCLMTIANLVVMILVFIAVFQALGMVGRYNINRQYIALQEVFYIHATPHQVFKEDGTTPVLDDDNNPIFVLRIADADADAFHTEINEVFQATRTRFLWVSNIWRSDTPWTHRIPGWSDFRSAARGVENSVFDDYTEQYLYVQFHEIFYHVDGTGSRGNGYLLLVLLAGVTMFGSAWINQRIAKKTKTMTKERCD